MADGIVILQYRLIVYWLQLVDVTSDSWTGALFSNGQVLGD